MSSRAMIGLLCASLALLASGVSGCERVEAAAVTRQLPDYIVSPRGMRPAASDADSEGPTLLDRSSTEPTDVAETTSAPVPSDPDPAATIATPRRWSHRFAGVIDGVRTDRRVVALTFDDGPTANTHRLVDELDAAGAHATFFWVGSRITTDAARYAVEHGEELANHTWTHPNMRRLTSEEASEQIGFTNARIFALTGKSPIWFRSPFNRLYQRELDQIQAHGLLYANYNVTSIDWMKGASEADVVGKISDNLRPGGVILMHDSPNHPPIYVPAVLRLLKSRGYDVVTMSDLARHAMPVREKLTLGVRGLGY